MMHIDGFCIDRFEAHLVVGERGRPMALWPHNRPVPSNKRYEARAAAGQFPQGYINQLEAARACDNAGKRLCRFDEWRRSCLGPRKETFGYGNDEEPKRCNYGKPNLLDQLWGHDARRWSYEAHMNHPLLNAVDGFLARSGEYRGCESAPTVHDQVGNLHEWVAERVNLALARRIEGEPIRRQPQPYRIGNGMLMGGFFSTGKQHGPGCYYVTLAHLASYHDYSTGFRCCADATVPSRP
jgi:formylglycine-generating enzyme required for sulfatase activity